MARLARAAVVGLVAAGTAVAVVIPANAAQAAVTPPAPVTQLSSVLAAEAGPSMTTSEAVGGLTATGGTGIAAGTAVSAVPVATVAGYAAGGFLIGFSAAGSFLQFTGLTSTGSFACDTQQLTGWNWLGKCPTAPLPTYVPNSDVQVHEPGYDRSPAAFGIWGDSNGWNSGSFAVAQQPTGVPAYSNTSGFTLSLPMTFGGSCTSGTYNGAGVNVRVSVLDPNGSPTGVQYSAWVIGTRYAACAPAGGTLTMTLPQTSTGFGGLRISGASSALLSGQSVPYIDWYPVGSSLRPPDTVPDPTRTFQTDWTCSDGSTHSVSSATFTESDATWPAVPSASCSGTVVTHVQVWETSTAAGGTRSLWTWDAPAAVGDALTQHPQCVGGGCQLLLSRIDATTGAALDCFSSSSVCATWWTDTASATTNTSEYQCTYGGDVVALSECTVYAHAFDPQNATYADPRNGDAPAPSAGGQPAPSDNCPPPFSWAGLFNPWWYFQGGLCAMQAAFVPSAATATDWQTFVGDVQTHPPVSIAMGGVQFTNDVIAGVNGQGDCSSLPLQMADQQLQGPTATFDLCAGVKQAAATTWGQAVELVVTIAIIGWAAWIVMHRIGRSFGSKA